MSSGFFQPFLDDYAQMLACPDPLLLEAQRRGELAAEARAALQAHLAGCVSCRQRLQHLERTPASESVPGPDSALLSQGEERIDAQSESRSDRAPRELAVGQIWSTRAVLHLSEHGLPDSGQPVRAGFLRLFTIAAIGPRHFGRYQEVCLCPLNEQTELAAETDLLLDDDDTPFGEPVMLETGNLAPALALQLETDLGQLSPQALAHLLAMLQGEPGKSPRGGRIISLEGPHSRFQALERAELAYLAAPLEALAELRRLSSRYLLGISPKGLHKLAAGSPPTSLFPARRQQQSDRVLAASTGDLQSAASPLAFKESLLLTDGLQLDLWVEAANLEFYACTSEQMPVAGLGISCPGASGMLIPLVSDALGTAFVPLVELARGEILIEFTLQSPALRKLLPVQLQD